VHIIYKMCLIHKMRRVTTGRYRGLGIVSDHTDNRMSHMLNFAGTTSKAKLDRLWRYDQ
jgi:hypothetical protein